MSEYCALFYGIDNLYQFNKNKIFVTETQITVMFVIAMFE